MSIMICGDTLPTEINMREFESGAVDKIITPELMMTLRKADYRIANLEGCFVDGGKPISKTGPNLKASIQSFEGIKQLGFNLFGIANNHIMDYGTEGLTSTIDLLNNSNISWCGAGKTLDDAYNAHFVTINNTKVGIIALAEREYTIATKSKPGAAPFDDLDSPDFVSYVKDKVDFLIVLYHGGKEYYRYPAPYVQKRCRKIVEKGADIVITQHSHCIGCYETYMNGKIIYGQGNFLLSRGNDNEFRRTGLLLEVDIESHDIEFHVVVRNDPGVRLANKQEYEEVMDGFTKRSDDLRIEGFIEQKYGEFADNALFSYQTQSLGRVAAFMEKFKCLNKVPRLYDKDNMLVILNTLRCEAHRDLYIQGLINKLSDEK